MICSQSRENLHTTYILIILVLVNVTCECFRYLFVYLSAVSTSGNCSAVCEGTLPPTPSCGASDACSTCRSRYSILDGSCISTSQYGILAGPAFAILYACFGLFAGRLTDALNRRVLHTVAIVSWSSAVLAQGASRTFWHMVLCRLLLGVAESFQAPCSYSLISEHFDLSRRSRANGIFAFGIYLGGGAASLSILLAEQVGWRRACFLYGFVGVGVAALYGATIRNRKTESVVNEGNAVPSMEEEGEGAVLKCHVVLSPLRAILSRRRVVLLLVASSIRFYAGNSIGAFLPVYMGRAFPDQTAEYSTFNALIICFGGAASAYAGGLAADVWGKSSPRALALVPAIGSFLAVLPMAGVVFLPGHFVLAMLCLLIEYLMAECWLGPALTILQENVATEVQGLAVGVLLFCCTLVGELAPVIIGQLDPGDARGLAAPLFWNVAVAYVISGVVFMALAGLLHQDRHGAGARREGSSSSLLLTPSIDNSPSSSSSSQPRGEEDAEAAMRRPEHSITTTTSTTG